MCTDGFVQLTVGGETLPPAYFCAARADKVEGHLYKVVEFMGAGRVDNVAHTVVRITAAGECVEVRIKDGALLRLNSASVVVFRNDGKKPLMAPTSFSSKLSPQEIAFGVIGAIGVTGLAGTVVGGVLALTFACPPAGIALAVVLGTSVSAATAAPKSNK